MSRTGLVLGLLYVAASVAAVAAGAWADDPKGRFVFFQVPIALQGALVSSIGLGASLRGLSWPMAYLVLGAPTLLLLYAAGASIDRALGKGGHDDR